jgi:hypothetical protein
VINPAYAFLLLGASQPGQVVTIQGREMAGLHNVQQVISGTCDGRPASATIRKGINGQGAQVVLRSRRWIREIPGSFLNGALRRQSLTSLGLACDGTRLQLLAVTVRADARSGMSLISQTATLNLRTGVLTIGELVTENPAETMEMLVNSSRPLL